ncbi:hypothetical protein JB92DRAFT_103538 [Gautieria morchelliformis]|nr:hypothetical protein JB92DRAFT_103538 [Gautieria morchelliformis]
MPSEQILTSAILIGIYIALLLVSCRRVSASISYQQLARLSGDGIYLCIRNAPVPPLISGTLCTFGRANVTIVSRVKHTISPAPSPSVLQCLYCELQRSVFQG